MEYHKPAELPGVIRPSTPPRYLPTRDPPHYALLPRRYFTSHLSPKGFFLLECVCIYLKIDFFKKILDLEFKIVNVG